MNEENEKSSWDYSHDGDEQSTPDKKSHSNNQTVSWSASEFIDHSHGPEWFAILIAATLVIAVLIYLITKDYFATGVTVVVGIILGIFATRKPNLVTYEINESNLVIGQKTYDYDQFKSFAVMREGNLSSINLLPLKRYMPPISAYFAPEDEEKIVAALGEHLPYEDRKLDSMDRLTRRLRI